MSNMDSRKIFNADQIGLSPYNKMEDDAQSSCSINGYSQNGRILNTNANTNNSPASRCLWPHHWTLNECCCGCSLRVACLLIGWFYMLGSSLLLFSFMYLPRIAISYRWEDVIFTGLKFVASVVLLVGTYKDKVRVIRTAAVLYVIDVIVEIVLAIVVSVQMSQPYPIIVLILGVPLAIYFLVAVNSYANELTAKLSQRSSITANIA